MKSVKGRQQSRYSRLLGALFLGPQVPSLYDLAVAEHVAHTYQQSGTVGMAETFLLLCNTFIQRAMGNSNILGNLQAYGDA